MDVPVYNMQGQSVGSFTIDEESLGGVVNHALLKQAFVRYHANRRQGSARTKSRGMIEGSTKKLYRQKGTGRARMGTLRTPVRKGGGVAFAKTRTGEDFRQDMPVKMRRKANRNALLAKLVDNEVKIIQDLKLDQVRTKDVESLLSAMNIDRSCLMAIAPDNVNARKSARNVAGLSVCPPTQLTVYEMLNHRYLVISKADLEAWLNGPSSKVDKSAKADVRSRNREEVAA